MVWWSGGNDILTHKIDSGGRNVLIFLVYSADKVKSESNNPECQGSAKGQSVYSTWPEDN